MSRKDGGDFVTSLYLGSRAFAIGPKVFAPSLDTCVALEHVDLNFPWEEFRLPYPSLVVEYPKSWAARMVQAYGLRHTPVAAMIGEVGPDQVHVWVRHAGRGELHGVLTNRPEYRTVEDIMAGARGIWATHGGPGGCQPVSQGEKVLKRVTVNLAVLLSHCGTKELGWADPDGRARHERKRGRRGEALALGDLVRVEPSETIPVFTVSRLREGAGEAAGTHNSPRPHWRRGHWRMQPHGEGRLLRRQVFIAPIFVCGDGERIDPSDYPLRYEE